MDASGGTLYVVDDEPIVLELVEHVLFDEPCLVKTFAGAEEALKALEQAETSGEEVSMLLLDMFLGESKVSADTLFETVISKRPTFDVVIMSGRLSTKECYQYVLRGAADYLHKPFTIYTFKELVRYHMDIGRRRHAYSSSPWSAIRRTERDVFLSYCSDDREWALGLKRLLERSGLSVWYGDLDGKAAGKWQSGILTEALDRCRAALLLLTPNALDSQSVRSEIERALDRKAKEGENYLLIPLMCGLNGHRLPDSLRNLRSWDFTDQQNLVDNLLSLTSLIQASIHPSSHLEAYPEAEC